MSLDRQLLAIVGIYDYHMILCKLLNPSVSPCEALVKGESDSLSAKGSKPDRRTLKEVNLTREFHRG